MITREEFLPDLAGFVADFLEEFDDQVFNTTVQNILTDDEMGELYDIHEIMEELLGRIEDLGKEVA